MTGALACGVCGVCDVILYRVNGIVPEPYSDTDIGAPDLLCVVSACPFFHENKAVRQQLTARETIEVLLKRRG